MLLATLEWFELDLKKMGWLTAAATLYVCSVMLVLRQNFFMDIFTGMVAAHLIFRMSKKYDQQINRLLMVPYNLIRSKFK